MPEMPSFIAATWPAPARVRALTTTRSGGVSRAVYDSFNLADHVGDRPQLVAENRRLLRAALALPAEPVWLTQVHGTRVVDAATINVPTAADGSFTDVAGVVCAVLTADCLPLFLCDRAGKRVALVHAGWRGLAAGIIRAGVTAMQVPGGELLAWLGPAIGADAFEVGAEVRGACLAAGPPAAAAAFRPAARSGHWWADLYALARTQLNAAGVHAVFGGGHCTFREASHFYSYRRDGVCGRMASLIWLDEARR